MATLDQVIAQMAAADMPPLPPGHPVVDGKIHRYGPRSKAWYVLHDFLGRNGRRFIAGAFGVWRGAENNSIKVEADWSGIDADERQRLLRAQAAQEQREREKLEQRSKFAANRARQQWDAARAEGKSPYLERKGLRPAKGLRYFSDGTLVVPMVRYDVPEEEERAHPLTGRRRLVGLQKIAPDGTKLYNRGMAKSGAACRLGAKPKDGELILIGEGVATVLSVLEAFEQAYPAFIAFDAGNLGPVARIVRELYPKSPILFLADDDAYLEAQFAKRLRDEYGVAEPFRAGESERTFGDLVIRGADLHEDARGTPLLTAGVERAGKLRILTFVNAGRTKAWEASAEAKNAWVCWPAFRDRRLHADPDRPRFTDFNDLHAAEGLDVVRDQVGAALEAVRTSLELAQAIAGGTPPPPPETPGQARARDPDEPDWHLHSRMLRRYTLIYPSDSMVFDDELGCMVTVQAMRNLLGARPVATWMGSPRRRWITPQQVVFDPAMTSDRASSVNLFRGIEMKPSATASCAKLIELAHYLCGEEGRDHAPITEWVLRWMAYPLQHPGAKLESAIVMFGPEGTGKNLLFGALRKIYGKHAGLITQSELEDKHNTWLSAKLFLIANEVVTRAEMTHHVGRLKNLITEPEIYINPKGVDQRYENNHCNLVFLSNELQPLKINVGDRRYMVIRTPNEKPVEFYKGVGEELAAGGAEALYRYLLDLDLADFTRYTKPVMTEAKADLIEIGMPASQLFWHALHPPEEGKLGELGLPYCPALVEDVYRAYTIWCARNGERVPERINRFVPSFMSLNGVRRGEVRVADADKPRAPALEERLRKRRVLLMGPPRSDPGEERGRVLDGIVDFRRALRDYAAEGRGASVREGQEEAAF